MVQRVLVVDDDPDVIALVRDALEDAGFRTLHASDGQTALAVIRAERPDLVLLDLTLPGTDGFDVCRQIRGDPETADLPVIMLTGKAAEVDRVVGLEIGADDYVVKPFSARELVARVKAVLRRTVARAQHRRHRAGSIEIDEGKHRVTVSGRPVDLTATEFAILRAIVQAGGDVVGREQLCREIWGDARVHESQSRRLDMHLSHLRDKLATEGRRIVTVRGVGFRFEMSD